MRIVLPLFLERLHLCLVRRAAGRAHDQERCRLLALMETGPVPPIPGRSRFLGRGLRRADAPGERGGIVLQNDDPPLGFLLPGRKLVPWHVRLSLAPVTCHDVAGHVVVDPGPYADAWVAGREAIAHEYRGVVDVSVRVLSALRLAR